MGKRVLQFLFLGMVTFTISQSVYAELAKGFVMKFTLVDASSQNAPVGGATLKIDGPDFHLAATTDASGQADIQLPVTRPRYLAIHASRSGYVPRLVTWSLEQPTFNLPTTYLLKTEKGHTIGGVVKNESGQPVEGAKVVLIIRGSSMGGMSEQVFNDIWEHRVVTDKEGKWRYESAPSDLRALSVWVEHPDYISNDRCQERPKIEEFQKLSAVLTVRKGVPCAGTVTDGAGKPIAEAKIVYGEAGAGSVTSPSVKTDTNGNFCFNAISIQMEMVPPILTVYAKGYAPKMMELPVMTMSRMDRQAFTAVDTNGVRGYVPTTLDPVKELGTLHIQLSVGKPLRLRFVNKKGQPLEGISLHPEYWKKHQPFIICGFKSGKDGVAVWENAPDEEITYDVIGDRIQRKTVVLKPSASTPTIELRRNTVASGKVTDAATGKEISHYILIWGTHFPQEHPAWSCWARGSGRKMESSTFTQLFDEPAHLQAYGGAGPGTDGFHRLRVEAEGYEPGVSRPIANEEEDVEINFALKPAPAIRGVVRAVDGQPVKDAQVIVAGAGNAIQIRDGISRAGWDQLIVRTNEKGEYLLPAQEENYPIAIAHPDAGYAVTTFAELKAHPDVQLTAWGRLQLVHADLSGAQIPYSVSNLHEFDPEYQKKRITFEVGKPEKTGADTLLYKQLAAGDLRVGRFGHSVDEGPIAHIESGKISVVDLGKSK